MAACDESKTVAGKNKPKTNRITSRLIGHRIKSLTDDLTPYLGPLKIRLFGSKTFIGHCIPVGPRMFVRSSGVAFFCFTGLCHYSMPWDNFSAYTRRGLSKTHRSTKRTWSLWRIIDDDGRRLQYRPISRRSFAIVAPKRVWPPTSLALICFVYIYTLWR